MAVRRSTLRVPAGQFGLRADLPVASSGTTTTQATTKTPPTTPPTTPATTKAQAPLQAGPGAAHAKTLGAVKGSGAKDAAAIDGAVGVHLKKALGGASLLSGAANARHAEKMEGSRRMVAVVEKLPGRLGSLTSLQPKEAFALYEHCFPNPDEREPIADIKARLKTYDKGADADGACFHAHAYADGEGHVVGYAQGSTVPTPGGDGLFYYWQYGCVADKSFMQDHHGKDVNPREHGVLNTMHGVAAATLQAGAVAAGKQPIGIVWESEPRGLGDDPASIAFTGTRLDIHNKAGGRVMMGVDADGQLINLHLQPRLSADSEPIALHMMLRPLAYNDGDEQKNGALPLEDARELMLGFVDNFRREGFAEADVKEAEDEIKARFARCTKIVLLTPSAVPDVVTLAKNDPILARQVLDMYGVDDLAAARRVYDAAVR